MSTDVRIIKLTDGSIVVEGFTYSRADISRATGISISHVSRIFTGNRIPSIHVAKSICSYLRISLDDLYSFLGSINKSMVA